MKADFPLVDTHCHLHDKRIFPLFSELFSEAKREGVAFFLNCASTEEDWQEVLDLSVNHKELIPFLGLHPFYLNERSDNWEETLADLLKKNPETGIGEAGLDGFSMKQTLKEQERVLIKHLALSREFERPLSLHCRKAWGLMLEILKKEGGLPCGGAFHAFSGAADLVPELEKLGAHISFAASLTKSANKKVKASALRVSADRLLIETDAPDILPCGVKEGINRPVWLKKTFKALANIRRLPEELMAESLFKNSLNFLSPIKDISF